MSPPASAACLCPPGRVRGGRAAKRIMHSCGLSPWPPLCGRPDSNRPCADRMDCWLTMVKVMCTPSNCPVPGLSSLPSSVPPTAALHRPMGRCAICLYSRQPWRQLRPSEARFETQLPPYGTCASETILLAYQYLHRTSAASCIGLLPAEYVHAHGPHGDIDAFLGGGNLIGTLGSGAPANFHHLQPGQIDGCAT